MKQYRRLLIQTVFSEISESKKCQDNATKHGHYSCRVKRSTLFLKRTVIPVTSEHDKRYLNKTDIK